MTEVHDLILGERTGLPDAVAYLRGKYPPAHWLDHPNYESLRTTNRLIRFAEDAADPRHSRRAWSTSQQPSIKLGVFFAL